MPHPLRINEGCRRRPGAVDQDDLLHWVDIILEIVERSTSNEVYVVICQVMEHLVQTDLDHNADQSAGGH